MANKSVGTAWFTVSFAKKDGGWSGIAKRVFGHVRPLTTHEPE